MWNVDWILHKWPLQASDGFDNQSQIWSTLYSKNLIKPSDANSMFYN